MGHFYYGVTVFKFSAIVIVISFTYLKFLVSKCEHFEKLEAGHLGKF